MSHALSPKNTNENKESKIVPSLKSQKSNEDFFRRRLDEARITIREQRNVLDAKEAEIKDLKGKNEILIKEQDELNCKLNDQVDQTAALKTKLAKAELELKNAKHSIKYLEARKKEMNDLKQSLSNLNQEISKLTQSLDDSEKEKEELETMNQSLNHDATSKSDEIKNLNQQLAEKDKEISSLKSRLREQDEHQETSNENKLAVYKSWLDDRKRHIEELKNTIDEKEKKIKCLEEDNHKKDMDRISLGAEIKDVKSVLQLKNIDIEELQAKNKILLEHNRELQTVVRQSAKTTPGAKKPAYTPKKQHSKKPTLRQQSINTMFSGHTIKQEETEDDFDSIAVPKKGLKRALVSSSQGNPTSKKAMSNEDKENTPIEKGLPSNNVLSSTQPTSSSRAAQPTLTNFNHTRCRAEMIGETCTSCANFYGNETLTTVNQHGEATTVTGKERAQMNSRHRNPRNQRAATPPGFWETDFSSPERPK